MSECNEADNASVKSYPAFAVNGLMENLGKNLKPGNLSEPEFESRPARFMVRHVITPQP